MESIPDVDGDGYRDLFVRSQNWFWGKVLSAKSGALLARLPDARQAISIAPSEGAGATSLLTTDMEHKVRLSEGSTGQRAPAESLPAELECVVPVGDRPHQLVAETGSGVVALLEARGLALSVVLEIQLGPDVDWKRMSVLHDLDGDLTPELALFGGERPIVWIYSLADGRLLAERNFGRGTVLFVGSVEDVDEDGRRDIAIVKGNGKAIVWRTISGALDQKDQD